MSTLRYRQNSAHRTRIPRDTREAAGIAQDSANRWNAQYPPGTRVKVYTGLRGDESTAIETQTSGPAFVAAGLSAKVYVQNCGHAVFLTHCVPLLARAKHAQGEDAGVVQLSAVVCELLAGARA